jgi:L-iditol 2-dehydrogenase
MPCIWICFVLRYSNLKSYAGGLLKVKAAVYYGPGDMRVEERRKPVPGVDGAVVKVKDCGVCGFIDIPAWETPDLMGAGRSRGHEWSAEIVELGSNVRDFKVGERVYIEPVFRPCYRCEACLQKDYWRCSHPDMALDGAFAEYLWLPFLPRDGAVKMPDDISMRDLALIEPLGLSVGVAMKAKPGDTVVVIGQHLVGLGITAYLKQKMDVARVITGSVSKKHLKASEEVGANVAVNVLEKDLVKTVLQETKGRGADQVMVTDWRPGALVEAIGSLKRAGIIWGASYGFPIRLGGQLGQTPRYQLGMDYHGPIEPAISFDPGFAYMRTPWGTLGLREPRFKEAIDLMKSGIVTADKYVTDIFPLDKTKEAFDRALDINETIEVMVEI